MLCQALGLARKKGLRFNVLVCVSKSGDISYGKITQVNFEQLNIKARLIDDNQINR